MRTVFLVKKDPYAEMCEDNWIIMSKVEFKIFMSTPEGRRRKKDFGRLGGDDEADIIIAECGREKAKEWEREENRSHYLFLLRKDSREESIYGDQFIPENIYEPGKSVEDCVLDSITSDDIRNAVDMLMPDERMLIEKMYLEDSPMGRTQYSEYTGMSDSSVRRKRDKALSKLKSILEEEIA